MTDDTKQEAPQEVGEAAQGELVDNGSNSAGSTIVEQATPSGQVTESAESLPADEGNAALIAAEPSENAEPSSAALVLPAAGTEVSNSESSAEPVELTFEERVEQRFLAIEKAIQELPHSIHSVLQQGSHDTESFAKSVLHHLFSKF
ncbi:MAG TPA: hypothetical protein VN815_13480 [Steroidobacteraceae bacterium]|nr:hypothetical protein [Steroidobacteraceae bacterium]